MHFFAQSPMVMVFTENHAGMSDLFFRDLTPTGVPRFRMKAIGYYKTGRVDVLLDYDLPRPNPGPRDLLVEVQAIS
jgi:hypothetical protein